MFEIKPLNQLEADDYNRIVTGYVSQAKYAASKTGTEEQTTITLTFVHLPEPHIKRYDRIDGGLFDHYQHIIQLGFSFGAYQGRECVGIAIAEPEQWNRSLHVRELHVAEKQRNHGIGRQLMETLAGKGRAAGFRNLVCETQNTNMPAINFYRKLGCEIEAIDLSLYSNNDYPDGEIAIFMKKNLG